MNFYLGTRNLGARLLGLHAFAGVLGLSLGVGLFGTARSAPLQSGDLLVADFGALLVIPQSVGTPIVFASGEPLFEVMGVAVGPQGQVYVSNQANNAQYTASVIRIDPATGSQQVVSQAGLLTSPGGLAVGPDGWIYAANQYPGTILKIDPTTGTQSVVTSGLNYTGSIAMGSSGPIYATASFGGYNLPLVAIDPATGARTTVFGQSDHLAQAVAVDPSGKILLLTNYVVNNQLFGYTIYSIDPVAFLQTVVADIGGIQDPVGIVGSTSGAVFVSGTNSTVGLNTGTLLEVTGPYSVTPIFTGGQLHRPSQMAIYHGSTTVPAISESWGHLKARYR